MSVIPYYPGDTGDAGYDIENIARVVKAVHKAGVAGYRTGQSVIKRLRREDIPDSEQVDAGEVGGGRSGIKQIKQEGEGKRKFEDMTPEKAATSISTGSHMGMMGGGDTGFGNMYPPRNLCKPLQRTYHLSNKKNFTMFMVDPSMTITQVSATDGSWPDGGPTAGGYEARYEGVYRIDANDMDQYYKQFSQFDYMMHHAYTTHWSIDALGFRVTKTYISVINTNDQNFQLSAPQYTVLIHDGDILYRAREQYSDATQLQYTPNRFNNFTTNRTLGPPFKNVPYPPENYWHHVPFIAGPSPPDRDEIRLSGQWPDPATVSHKFVKIPPEPWEYSFPIDNPIKMAMSYSPRDYNEIGGVDRTFQAVRQTLSNKVVDKTEDYNNRESSRMPVILIDATVPLQVPAGYSIILNFEVEYMASLTFYDNQLMGPTCQGRNEGPNYASIYDQFGPGNKDQPSEKDNIRAPRGVQKSGAFVLTRN